MVLHIPLLKTGRPRPERSSDASCESWSHFRTPMEDEGSDRAPFRKWAVDETAAPQCFDSWRMNQIPVERREGAWLQRRRHSPCGLLVPVNLAMDSVYYRFDGEQPYVYALSRLGTESPEVPLDGLGLQFMCRSSPYVPFSWPSVRASGPKAAKPASSRGQIVLPGDPHPRDSAYALIRASMLAGHGNPTRFLEAHWWEARHRRKGVLLSWTQVEYYEQSAMPKDTLYPKVPSWFTEYDVPGAMYVPQPGVVAYRGKALLNNDPLHWAIFRTEWVVNVFARWVDDAYYRGLLWHLPGGVRSGVDRLTVTALLQDGAYSVASVDELLRLHDHHSWATNGSETTVLSKVVPLARRGGSFDILDWVEPNSRSHTVGVYPGDMTVPGSPEYEYLPRESVLTPLAVPRIEVSPATRVMTNEGPPLRSVPMDPVESRANAVYPLRSHRGTGARELQAPSETARRASVDPWKDSRVTSRYEPESYASDPYAAPTLRVPLLQSRLRELGLWVGVVGKYGDGHILDEETILAALAGLTAERDQARERADFAEGTARDMAKQDRERKDDLEMEVRRIRMALEHVTNATERLDEMTSRKRRREE
jgi:hypothetical protein